MDICKAEQTQCLQRPVTMLQGNLHGLLKERRPVKELVPGSKQQGWDAALWPLKDQLQRTGSTF